MRLGQKLFAEAVRTVFDLVQFIGANGIPQGINSGLSLSHGQAGLQPSENVEPFGAAVFEIFQPWHYLRFHRHGNEDFRYVPHNRAVESFLRNPQNGEGASIDADALSHNPTIESESPLPVGETQHHHRIRVRYDIVRRHEQPANRGLNSEDVEIISGYQLG